MAVVAWILLWSAGLAAAAATNDAHGSKLVTTKRVTSTACVEGRRHELEYETTGYPDSAYVDLDSATWTSRLKNVTCDIDHTKIALEFNSRAVALEWTSFFHLGGTHFIVGGQSWNCSLTNGDEMIMRRVMGWQSHTNGILGTTLTVATTLVRYDELYQDASIKFSTNGTCSTVSKHVCLEWNAGCKPTDSPSASGPIPFYSSTGAAHFNAACSNCFARFDTDVFVQIVIKNWQLDSLTGGFRNSSLNAGLVAVMDSQANWGSSISKQLGISPKTLLRFKVGMVPFELGFEVPMQLDAEFDVSGSVHAQLGATAAIAVGDTSVAWSPTSHWSHSVVEPAYSFTPVLEASDAAASHAYVKLSPTFKMHFNRVFTYQAALTPFLHAEVQTEDSSSSSADAVGGQQDAGQQQICMKAIYGMDLVTTAEMHINIPFANIHRDRNWGPTIVTSKAGHRIPPKCIGVRRGNATNETLH